MLHSLLPLAKEWFYDIYAHIEYVTLILKTNRSETQSWSSVSKYNTILSFYSCVYDFLFKDNNFQEQVFPGTC